jgi:lipoyl(octanoyl) transferase
LIQGEEWRLIGLEAGRGDANMATDEALLEYAAAGPPTLRLFTWSEPWLSIGCLQQISDVDVSACQRAGIPIVRRASGGTAVLHESTLAFSLVVPAGHPLAVSDIVESYRLLAPPARLALRSIGISAELVRVEEAHRGRPNGFGSAACFAALAPYELVVGSRKLVGNSQLRRRGAILHHAVMNLDFNPGRFAGFLKTGSLDEVRKLSGFLDARVGSLGGVLARQVSAEEAALAVVKGFEDAYGVKLVSGVLSVEETRRARELVLDKYGSDSWTYRR